MGLKWSVTHTCSWELGGTRSGSLQGSFKEFVLHGEGLGFLAGQSSQQFMMVKSLDSGVSLDSNALVLIPPLYDLG